MRLRRQVEPRSVYAVLNLENPEIWVKCDLARQARLCFAGIDRWPRVRADKHSVDAERRIGGNRLRRGSVERRASVQVIDFDEYGAGLGSAPSAQDGAHPFHSTPTQIGRDPDVGAQTHRA
jgi:hypothetical protein